MQASSKSLPALLLPMLAVGLGLFLLAWPLYVSENYVSDIQNLSLPILWAALVPISLLLFGSEIIHQTFNPRLLAVVAALAAVGMLVRLLGAGVAGLEPIWTVVLLAGLALGPSAGFLVGITAIFLSAVLTGGIGPWLPYQMLAAGLLGLIGGAIPSVRIRTNRFFLMILGMFAGLLYGWLLNLWFWPTAFGLDVAIAFLPSDSATERVAAWIKFNLVTSLGFDLPRGLLTGFLLAWVGPRLMIAIQRAARTGSITHSPNLQPK